MTLLGYFWDRWPSLAGKLSCDVTTTQLNSALHPSRVAKSSTSFVCGTGGIVTAAGLQVTLCDPILHVISRSGEVISTNCYIRFTFFTSLTMSLLHWQQCILAASLMSSQLKLSTLMYKTLCTNISINGVWVCVCCLPTHLHLSCRRRQFFRCHWMFSR